jgi:RHS repeat-associated protein
MAQNIYIGLAVDSGSSSATATATFDNIYVNNVPVYSPPPSISSLSTNSGEPGTTVTISGSNFGGRTGTVTFNGQTATISSWSASSITAKVPNGASSGNVIVNTGVAQSNGVAFTVLVPAISGVSPQTGPAGTSVTVSGSNFGASAGTVTFNGQAATTSAWADSSITAVVPSSATSGNVIVTNGGLSSNGISFTVTPGITGLSPTSGDPGVSVIISGSHFGSSPGSGGGVTFNGTSAGISSWTDGSITAMVPIGASSGNVVVTSAAGLQSNAVAFTVTDNLAITSVSPTTGPVGTTVTVIGGGFGSTQGSSTLSFNGIPATITSWSENQIIATIAPGTSTGLLSVTLGGGGIAWSAAAFVITTTIQVADSFNNLSSYTSAMLGGTWQNTVATGSGCSSCTVRGNIGNIYDAGGNLLSHTDELGHVTTYTYDANNNLASVSAKLDSNNTITTSYTYNSFGEPLTVTDPLGNVTTNTYDTNGNLLTITTPKPTSNTAASVTTFAYNSLGELTQITDPLSHLTTLSYTPAGLISTITDAQNNVTTYQYDAHGNRTAVIDPLQHITSFAYDAMDRLTTITYPDTTTASFGYDYRGRRTSITDQDGNTTTYAYDDADRLTSVTDAASNVTRYSYDTENNLLSITDATGHVTSFTYDAFGRVTQTAFPSSLVESYIYDAVGNLANKTDRKNQSILYVYDALNRLTHKGYPDSTGVDYVYDLAGKIKQVTDPTGTYGFAYDNMGRLIGTTTQYTFLPGTTFTNSYAYDANSNRISFTAPDGSTNTYQYDTLNRLSTLTSSLTGQFTFGYDALSRRTNLTRPNAVNSTYSYDSLSRLLSVLHQNGTTTLDGATYTYDNAGNRTSKTNQLNNANEQYTYDAIYQLQQVSVSSQNQGATTMESYTYDAVGNRLTSLGVPSYTYNSSNELTSSSVASYTYDNNGNTLTKTVSGSTTQYAWDFENRLASVTLPGTGGTVTFKYDPFGRRIQKSGASIINYLYDGANAIEEVDSSGNVLAKYLQGAGIDEPLSELRSGAVSYYEQDGLGSVTSLSGSGGVLANTYVYDSFGNPTGFSGTVTNPYQYTGRDYDSETGLRYYRARYYDSTTGRFLSEDPLKFQTGPNHYVYVANDPINLYDPSGCEHAFAVAS